MARITHRLIALGLRDELEDVLESRAFEMIDAGDERLAISSAIAAGNDGSIHVVKGRGDATFVAKRFKGYDLEKLDREAEHEVQMLQRFADPSARKAVDAGKRVYVFMQRAAGDLSKLSRAFGETTGAITDETRRLLARRTLQDIGAQLRAMHAAGFAHRDIKPGNIFFFPDGTLRLGDFGRACRVDSGRKSTGRSGTPTYSPTEVLNDGEALDTKSDTWSLGMTVLSLLVGERALPTTGINSPAVTANRVEELLELRGKVLHEGRVDFAKLKASKSPWANVLQRACMCDYDTTSYVLQHMVAPIEERRDADTVAGNAEQHFASFHRDAEDIRQVCGEAAAQQTQLRALCEVVQLAHEMHAR